VAHNIIDFIGSFKRPLFKNNRFEVQLPTLIGSDIDEVRNLTFRVENTEMPGRAATTIDNSYYGPVQKMGATAVYTDLQMTVLLSDDFREQEYFLRWSDKVVGDHRKEFGALGPASAVGFNIGYFDDYKQDVIIIAYNEQNEIAKKVQLREAYPVLVSPVNMAWNNDGFGRITVTLAYRYWNDIFVQKPIVQPSDVVGESEATFNGVTNETRAEQTSAWVQNYLKRTRQ
jgi:hypothetical protein